MSDAFWSEIKDERLEKIRKIRELSEKLGYEKELVNCTNIRNLDNILNRLTNLLLVNATFKDIKLLKGNMYEVRYLDTNKKEKEERLVYSKARIKSGILEFENNLKIPFDDIVDIKLIKIAYMEDVFGGFCCYEEEVKKKLKMETKPTLCILGSKIEVELYLGSELKMH